MENPVDYRELSYIIFYGTEFVEKVGMTVTNSFVVIIFSF